ncbi:MAG: Mut7-C RNAse domain-containing protein [Methanotrichaceae archaeon]
MRFIVDQMLLRLGRWLRLLGQDVANPYGGDDKELLKRAKEENRTLITRDKRLADSCSSAGVNCILIRSAKLEEQLGEMARLGIPLDLNPSRCTICNSPLHKVEPSEKEKWICKGCGKLYWQGSHWKRIEETLKNLQPGK